MKTKLLNTHLIDFITEKGLREEFNVRLDGIEKGQTKEGDALSKAISSKKQPDRQYGEFIPAILKKKGKPMPVADILAEYKAKAGQAGVTSAETVNEHLIGSFCDSGQAMRKGVWKASEKGQPATYKFVEPVTS